MGFETTRRAADQRGRPIGVGAPEGQEGQAAVPVGGGRTAIGHTHSPTSGIKLALLAQNGPFWHVFRMHGELCTVVVTNKPRMANFVPLSPGRSHAWRTLYRMRGRDGSSHHSTPGPTGEEGVGGPGGPGCGARGRWRGPAPEKSHVTRLGEVSTKSENVAIPTI